MKKLTFFFVIIPIGILFIYVAPGCNRIPDVISIQGAIDKELCTVYIRGIDVSKMAIQVNSHYNTTIVVPAGTKLKSNNADTQDMITAVTIRFVFKDDTTSDYQHQDVEVYCMNRFEDAPTEHSSYEVYSSDSSDSRDELSKLAACLENNGADHETRQLAIWMVSDDLINFPENEVAEKLKDNYERHAQEGIDDNRDKVIREMREETPGLDNYSDDDIIERIRAMNPALAKIQAENEIRDYKQKAAPLLQSCGIETAGKRFFQK